MTAGQDMLQVLRYLRAEEGRRLRGAALSGAQVLPSERNGLSCPVWVHAARSVGRPCVLEFHGGGFALGSAASNDGIRQWLCDVYDINVIGVDYRLAPEHPAPAQRLDALAAIRAVRTGRVPGLDAADKLVLMGFSAGACIALAAGLEAARAGEGVDGFALVYPFLDADAEPGEQEGLPSELVAAFDEWYLSGGADPRDPLVSPLFARAEELAALGACATCPVEGDYLADQAFALHRKMPQSRVFEAAGVAHGYIDAGTDDDVAHAQLGSAFDWLLSTLSS